MTFTTSSLSYLDGLTDQNQIEVETLDSFTDRYAPVQSISGGTITMQQPAWDNNTWGYDTMNAAGDTMYLENNYAFLQQAGQWYLDSATGQLYYKAASGQNPNSLDIELPQAAVARPGQRQLQQPGQRPELHQHHVHRHQLARARAAARATPTSRPARSSPAPGTSPRSASCYSGCQLFEATRQYWDQMPAAVQVSAATNITFSGDTFTDLGPGRPRHRQRCGRQLQRDRPGRQRHHRHRQHVQRRRGQRDRGRRSPGQRPPPEQPGDDRPEHHDQRQPRDRHRNRLQGDAGHPVHLRHRRDDHPQPGRPPALRRHRHRLGLGHQRPGRQPGLRQPGHLQLPAHLHHADHAEKQHGLLQPDLRHQERDARRRQHLQPVRQPRHGDRGQLHVQQQLHGRAVPRRRLPLPHRLRQRRPGRGSVGLHQRQRRTTTPTTAPSGATGTTAVPPRWPPVLRTTTC